MIQKYRSKKYNEINTSNKGRIGYIDRAKGLLMLLVVLGHCIGASISDTFIGLGILAWISSFHMPAFFIISGMLINKQKYHNKPIGEFIKEKFYRIVIPYFFFETIGCFLDLVSKKGEPLDLLSKVITMECVVGADWFLITYFFAIILYYAYLRLDASQICDAIIVLLILFSKWLAPLSFAESRWGINLFRVLIGFSMILFGSNAKKQLVAFRSYYQWGFLLVVGLVCIWLNGFVELWNATIGNPVLYILSVFSGTSLILGISQVVTFDLTRVIGENTISILSTHQMVLSAITKMKRYINNSFLFLGFSILVIVAVEPIIVWFLNRFCPHMIGKKWGDNIFRRQ